VPYLPASKNLHTGCRDDASRATVGLPSAADAPLQRTELAKSANRGHWPALFDPIGKGRAITRALRFRNTRCFDHVQQVLKVLVDL
jgi:hypothetical protein